MNIKQARQVESENRKAEMPRGDVDLALRVLSDGSVDYEYSIAIKNARIAALEAEAARLSTDREELINVAVKACLLIEEIGFGKMSEKAQALDSVLAHGLNDALWEIVNNRALIEREERR